MPSTFGTIAGAGIPLPPRCLPVSHRPAASRTRLQRRADAAIRTSRIPDHPGRREDGEARVRRAGLPRRALRSPERSRRSRLLPHLLPPLPFWSACRALPTPSPNSYVAPHCGTNEQPCRLPLSRSRKHIVAGLIRLGFSILLAKVRGDLVFDGWVKIRPLRTDATRVPAPTASARAAVSS